MKAKISVVTLGVSDLERAVRFYRDGLRFPLRGVFGNDADESTVAFFDLNGGIILALYPRPWLAKDAKLQAAEDRGAASSLGQLVGSKQEVDDVFAEAAKAGARITDPPHDRVWGGYSGYFQDPDGDLWEIVWNPDMPEA